MTDISTDEQEFKLQFIDGKHSVVMHVAKIFCAKLTFPHNSMLFSITFKEKVTFSPKNCTIRHISRTFVTRAADIENMDAFLLLYYTVTAFSFTVHCPAFLLIKISLKMHPYSPDLTACPIAKYIKCVTLFVLE